MLLLQSKDQTTSSFLQFKCMIEGQLDKKIKAIQFDDGFEFKLLDAILDKKGILCRFTSPYTLNKNGVIECHRRHIVEHGLALLCMSHMHLRIQYVE